MGGARTLVVGAAIVRDGRLLAARRTAPADVASRWELPGGKVEPGETPDAALVRELREELGLAVRVERWLDGVVAIGERHELAVAVAAADGDPVPTEHDRVRWLAADELDDVDWLEPDRPFLPRLAEALRRPAVAQPDPGAPRAVFFDADDARRAADRLRRDGHRVDVVRERYAGEDDDEDHPWAVLTDAPGAALEPVVDEHDGWLQRDEAPSATAAVPLPAPPGASGATAERGRPALSDPVTTLAAVAESPALRMLLVHAHPDDESIGQGATMARYVAEGRGVTLVTCTGGEMGEILVPELAHLAADQDDGLAEHRRGELADAMAALGVTDHRYLGGFGTYRDSGMQWHPDGHAIPGDVVDPRAFWSADLTEAATHLVEVIREVRPQVLVTYDEFGGYGHPDHIQAHRVAMYGALLAAVPSYRRDLGEAWDIEKVYWGAMSESRMRSSLRALRDAGDTTTFEGMDPDGPLPPFVTSDENLAAEVDGAGYVEAKMAALRAHATQITTDGPFFALADNLGNRVWGTEFYRLARGHAGPAGESGLEDDLFAGVEPG